MTKRFFWLAGLIIVCLGCNGWQAGDTGTRHEQLLRHIVLFEFKADTTDQQIKMVKKRFRQMAKRIKEIHDFEWGTNISSNHRNHGFTHCFMLTFRNETDLDKYQVYPIHTRLQTETGRYIKKILVIDYFARD